MRNTLPTLPDGRDGPFASELGWVNPQPPLAKGSYPDAFQATQRDGCDVARFGRAFWSECANAYHSIRPSDFHDVAARFRKGKEDHLGACLELLAARLLPELGMPLGAPDKEIYNPEFITTLGSTPTLVECKVSTALDDSVAKGNATKTAVLNAIQEFSFDGLYVLVSFTGATTKTPSMKALRREFDRWRTNLVIPVEHGARLSEIDLPRLVFPLDTCAAVTFSAASYMGAGQRGGVVFMHGDAMFCGEIYEKARDGVKEKSRKYQAHPLLVVLGASSSFADLDDLFDALFGPARHAIGINRTTGEIVGQSVSRGVKGALFDQNPKNTNVVGALMVAGHISAPWSARVALVPNPYTQYKEALRGLEQVLESVLGPGDAESWTARQIGEGLDLETLFAVPSVARMKTERIRFPSE
jgi:hypothetical protein